MPEILIIEDTENDAALLERALRAGGVTNPVKYLSNGADALAFLRSKRDAPPEERIAVVFIDLRLPDTDGLQILKLMHGRSEFARTLRIVITAIDGMENIRRAYALGADSFIVKPVNQLDVKELIRSFPEQWELEDDSAGSPGTEPEPKAPVRDSPSRTEAAWNTNRELIQNIRATLRTLRNSINDTEETFTIIETLTEELRRNCEKAPTPKRRPPTNLIL
jgi:CheY-like chemotaxis protein